jgi:hypothetical protein
MSITRKPARVIQISGQGVLVNDIKASAAITPGMLVEIHDDSGTPKYRAHATAGGNAVPSFMLNQSELNEGIDDACAAGDLIPVFVAWPGAVVNAVLPSGQDIEAGEFLESAGNGKLRVLASGVPVAQAIESVDHTGYQTADTRIKVQTL